MNIKCYFCQSELELTTNKAYSICMKCPSVKNYYDFGRSDLTVEKVLWQSPFGISNDNRLKAIYISFSDLGIKLCAYFQVESIQIRDIKTDKHIILLDDYVIPNLLDIPPEVLKNKIRIWLNFS